MDFIPSRPTSGLQSSCDQKDASRLDNQWTRARKLPGAPAPISLDAGSVFMNYFFITKFVLLFCILMLCQWATQRGMCFISLRDKLEACSLGQRWRCVLNPQHQMAAAGGQGLLLINLNCRCCKLWINENTHLLSNYIKTLMSTALRKMSSM